jgi:hypothetical protein
MGDFVVKDSGKRQEYATGARRDTNEGRGRFDLLPPHALTRLAQLYEKGALKYSERNWEKGIPLSRFFNSALRHMVNYLDGDRSEDHLAAVLFNIAGYIQTEKWVKDGVLPADLDDFSNVHVRVSVTTPRTLNGVPLVEGEPDKPGKEWLRFWVNRGPVCSADLLDRWKALGFPDTLWKYTQGAGITTLGRYTDKNVKYYWVPAQDRSKYADLKNPWTLRDDVKTTPVPLPIKENDE